MRVSVDPRITATGLQDEILNIEEVVVGLDAYACRAGANRWHSRHPDFNAWA